MYKYRFDRQCVTNLIICKDWIIMGNLKHCDFHQHERQTESNKPHVFITCLPLKQDVWKIGSTNASHCAFHSSLSLSLHVCQENKLIVVNSCFLARILYSSPILLPDLLRKDLFYLTSSMHHIFSYSNTCKPRQFAM